MCVCVSVCVCVRVCVCRGLSIGSDNPIFLLFRWIRLVARTSVTPDLSREKFWIESYGQNTFFRTCSNRFPIGSRRGRHWNLHAFPSKLRRKPPKIDVFRFSRNRMGQPHVFMARIDQECEWDLCNTRLVARKILDRELWPKDGFPAAFVKDSKGTPQRSGLGPELDFV